MQTPETSLHPRHQQETKQRGASGDGAEGCYQAKLHKPHLTDATIKAQKGGDMPEARWLGRVRFCATGRPGAGPHGSTRVVCPPVPSLGPGRGRSR